MKQRGQLKERPAKTAHSWQHQKGSWPKLLWQQRVLFISRWTETKPTACDLSILQPGFSSSQPGITCCHTAFSCRLPRLTTMWRLRRFGSYTLCLCRDPASLTFASHCLAHKTWFCEMRGECGVFWGCKDYFKWTDSFPAQSHPPLSSLRLILSSCSFKTFTQKHIHYHV